MPKQHRKLPKGIHVYESGSLYLCYRNQHGRIIRENTHQTDVNAAELMLAHRTCPGRVVSTLIPPAFQLRCDPM
jgi:hypothetical protein